MILAPHSPPTHTKNQTKKRLSGSLEFEMLFAQAKRLQTMQKHTTEPGGGGGERLEKNMQNIFKCVKNP